MLTIFVDAAFYVAMINTRDEKHQLAIDVYRRLRERGSLSLVTSYAVVFEVMAFYSRMGPELRESATRFVERLRTSPITTILPITDSLFSEALELYGSRLDQRYSLADCSSMIIARRRGITEILTADSDFRTEGFTILMPD